VEAEVGGDPGKSGEQLGAENAGDDRGDSVVGSRQSLVDECKHGQCNERKPGS
jgi:hypothetical protein